MCKLRVSAHNLAIERERYLTRDQRICEICKSGEIENEQHMLLHCRGYFSIRETFVLKMGRMTFVIRRSGASGNVKREADIDFI